MAEYPVKLGIDSISLNPDTVVKTTQRILDLEKRLRADADGASRPEELEPQDARDGVLTRSP